MLRISRTSLTKAYSLHRLSYAGISSAEQVLVNKPQGPSQESRIKGGQGQLSLFGGPKTGFLIEIKNESGALARVLGLFEAAGINLSFIQSQPPLREQKHRKLKIQLQAQEELDSSRLSACLGILQTFADFTILQPPIVPWFPTNLRQLNLSGKKLLKAGDGLIDVNHPGFKDQVYKRRRDQIAQMAVNYNIPEDEVPIVKYREDQLQTWNYCFTQLEGLYQRGACSFYLQTLDEMEKYCGFASNNIPQLRDISKYLYSKTGWRIRPVGGLLSQRQFLNGLAFKVFHSTQYIRHHSEPLYTPEPDIVHELMGHAPMFANQDFADLSQEIGLASLGASNADIAKLAALYWFTVEFGICKENGENKAYGAGVLSSVSELEWAMSGKAEYRPLDCAEVEKFQDFPVTNVQPRYFVAESFEEAKLAIQEYSGTLKRPFKASFCEEEEVISVDRKIQLQKLS